jgi:hypothetical protein
MVSIHVVRRNTASISPRSWPVLKTPRVYQQIKDNAVCHIACSTLKQVIGLCHYVNLFFQRERKSRIMLCDRAVHLDLHAVGVSVFANAWD